MEDVEQTIYRKRIYGIEVTMEILPDVLKHGKCQIGDGNEQKIDEYYPQPQTDASPQARSA